MIWTKKFWQGAGERAVKTFCQTFIAAVGVTGVGSTLGFGNVSWVTDLSVSGVAALLSLVTSVGNANFVAGESK